MGMLVRNEINYTGLSSASLSTLTDVLLDTPVKGQGLIYDKETQMWINGEIDSQNELDTTLSIAGAAADAKAVGDKFAEINPFMRYNQETDMIQIKDADGNWHDWAGGGLQILDVNEIALEDWIKEADSMLSSSSLLSVNPFVGRTVGNNISYNQGAKWTTRNAYELSGFKYARISYSGVNQGGNKSSTLANGKSKISIINAETGVETVIKDIISGNSSFDDNVSLGNLSGKYKIAITASSSGSVTSTLTVSCLKFSRSML